jgi:hypothetical protein
MKLVSLTVAATLLHVISANSEEFADAEIKRILDICHAGKQGDPLTPEMQRCIRRYDPDGKFILFSAIIEPDSVKPKKTK